MRRHPPHQGQSITRPPVRSKFWSARPKIPGINANSDASRRARGWAFMLRPRNLQRMQTHDSCTAAIIPIRTSSARASNDGGIARPSALAVLRLTTRSNLVGCSTACQPASPRAESNWRARSKWSRPNCVSADSLASSTSCWPRTRLHSGWRLHIPVRSVTGVVVLRVVPTKFLQ